MSTAARNNAPDEITEIATVSAFSQSLSVYDSYQRYLLNAAITCREVANSRIASLQKQLMELKDLVSQLIIL